MREIKNVLIMAAITLSFLLGGCSHAPSSKNSTSSNSQLEEVYTEFALNPDISKLSKNDRKIVALLIEAAEQMDESFWLATYGDKSQLLGSIQDPVLKKFVQYNYGPWDRLNGDKAFVPGVGERPKGAQYYPADIKREEVENSKDKAIKSLYTIVRRNPDGSLKAIPYSEYFKKQHAIAAAKMNEAAKLAKDPGFKNYLRLRAKALLSNEYQASDLAWMDMKKNNIDFVVGPIENYDDRLFEYKAAHEAVVLLKDMAWSKKLAKYAKFLPELQKQLPVEPKYKAEPAGVDSDLNAYDVLYVAGDSNAGSKTIAINLPNDEAVQLKKGSRRLQLKNPMKAKFEKILVPISRELIDESQVNQVSFDAFFSDTMFHEVAHGLGIKKTIDGKGVVRDALKELYSSIEEGKADILGLFLVKKLSDMHEFSSNMEEHYITFFAGIFRSIRFGASSAHGKANLIRYNYFKERGAFSRNAITGKFKVNFAETEKAAEELARDLIVLQGNGDYVATKSFIERYSKIPSELAEALERIKKARIPVDIVYKQGKEVLGLY